MGRAGKLKAYHYGRRGEWLALLLLLGRGYHILQRGYRCPLGEIDIIARRRARLAFVEVKARSSHLQALEAVGERQRRRIRQAANSWLASRRGRQVLHYMERNGKQCEISFDIITIAPWSLPRLHPHSFTH